MFHLAFRRLFVGRGFFIFTVGLWTMMLWRYIMQRSPCWLDESFACLGSSGSSLSKGTFKKFDGLLLTLQRRCCFLSYLRASPPLRSMASLPKSVSSAFVTGWEVPNSLEGVHTNPCRKGNMSFIVVSNPEEVVKVQVTILLQKHEWWWIIGWILTIGMNGGRHNLNSLYYAFLGGLEIADRLKYCLSHNFGKPYTISQLSECGLWPM